MTHSNKTFEDVLLQKLSATEGHPVLSQQEMMPLLNTCNGFLPSVLNKKVTPDFSGEETPVVVSNVNLFREKEKVGSIRFLIENTSKPVLIEHFRDWCEYNFKYWCAFNGGSASWNADDIVSKIRSMTAAEYYDLVYRIALFWADPDDIAQYVSQQDGI